MFCMTRRAFLLSSVSMLLVGLTGLAGCSEGKSSITIRMPYTNDHNAKNAEWNWRMSEVGIIEPTLIRSNPEEAAKDGAVVGQTEAIESGDPYALFAFETVGNGIVTITCALTPYGAPIHEIARVQWHIQVNNRLIATVTDYEGDQAYKDCLAIVSDESSQRSAVG